MFLLRHKSAAVEPDIKAAPTTEDMQSSQSNAAVTRNSQTGSLFTMHQMQLPTSEIVTSQRRRRRKELSFRE